MQKSLSVYYLRRAVLVLTFTELIVLEILVSSGLERAIVFNRDYTQRDTFLVIRIEGLI